MTETVEPDGIGSSRLTLNLVSVNEARRDLRSSGSGPTVVPLPEQDRTDGRDSQERIVPSLFRDTVEKNIPVLMVVLPG